MKSLQAVALVAAVACQPPTLTPRTSETGPAVHAWMTTGDQTKLLQPQPDVSLVPESGVPSGVAAIDVDETRSYQQMIGFGAAVTDASAYLIQQKMSAADREALLQDLFGREKGIRFSFIRVPMGASDFSLRHYSYDDMAGTATDSARALLDRRRSRPETSAPPARAGDQSAAQGDGEPVECARLDEVDQ